MDNNPATNNAQYCLSIRFLPDGFSLIVSDKQKKTLVSRHVYANVNMLSSAAILELLSQQQELNMTFGSIRLIVESGNYSLVPAQVFREGNAREFLKLLHPELPSNMTVLNNTLPPWNAIMLFAISSNLNEALQSILPELIPEHHLSVLMVDDVPLTSQTTFYAYFRNDMVDMLLFDEYKPLIVNSFECKAVEDFLYYALKIAGQFKVDSYQIPVTLFNAENRESYCAAIKNYFSRCEIYNKP